MISFVISKAKLQTLFFSGAVEMGEGITHLKIAHLVLTFKASQVNTNLAVYNTNFTMYSKEQFSNSKISSISGEKLSLWNGRSCSPKYYDRISLSPVGPMDLHMHTCFQKTCNTNRLQNSNDLERGEAVMKSF